MNPKELKYTAEHEWLKVDGERVYVGITDFAQKELGDVVFVELPTLDAEVKAGDTLGVVESVKAVSDIYAPIGGRVVEVNEALEDKPELINEDPYGDGWLCVLEPADPKEMEGLLSAEEYEKQIEA
ncbi:MAG: glycine cleavage system protein GcvH [Limnochordia bacterium]